MVVSAPRGCMLGLHVEERGGRIVGISTPAARLPILPGDTLVAVNGMPLADGAGALADRLKNLLQAAPYPR